VSSPFRSGSTSSASWVVELYFVLLQLTLWRRNFFLNISTPCV
jgi:hypothetical protein